MTEAHGTAEQIQFHERWLFMEDTTGAAVDAVSAVRGQSVILRVEQNHYCVSMDLGSDSYQFISLPQFLYLEDGNTKSYAAVGRQMSGCE